MPVVPYFTKENAKTMQIRSAESRRLRAAVVADALPSEQEQPCSEYTIRRLSRTRKQIAQVDAMLEREEEPRNVKALADALGRLTEIHRILSGQPLPGQLRPREPRAASQATTAPSAMVQLVEHVAEPVTKAVTKEAIVVAIDTQGADAKASSC
jgi:uncharacterized protein (DUF1501 family)